MKFKSKHYLSFLLIFLAPVLVNYIVLTDRCFDYDIAGGPKDWISFYGSFAGSVISGLITLFVLTSTLKSNKVQNDSQRDIQIKTVKYTQQQTSLENLRKQLINNYMMCDMHSLSIVYSTINKGFFADAKTLLVDLSKNIEFQTNTSDIYFLCSEQSKEEQKYNAHLKKIIISYGCFISDAIASVEILSLIDFKNIEATDINQIIDYSKKQYAFMLLNAKSDKQFTQYYLDGNSVISKILSLEPNDNFVQNLLALIDQSYKSIIEIHTKKHKLISVTKKLLISEEKKISDSIESNSEI